MRKQRLLLLGVFLILFLQLVSSVSIGEFERNEDVELYQTCNNCTSCIFTSIKYPNSTTILSNVMATQDGTYFNYTLKGANTTALGTYTYCYSCGNSVENETGCLEFTVTPSGKSFSSGESVAGFGVVFVALVLAFFFMFFGFKLSESESKNLIPVAMLFILVSFVFIIYSLHLSYAYTVDVFQYESLGDVTSVIYTSILWLLVGVGLISTILILMASIKLMGESIKRKEYGEDFNPVTDSYDF